MKRRRNSVVDENAVRKMNSSTLPSYKSSWEDLESTSNTPPGNIPDETNRPKHNIGKVTQKQFSQEDQNRNRQGSIFI